MSDWGAYLDGSMDVAERTQLEARLTIDEQLRQELAGYQAFVAAIQSAGHHEAIPFIRVPHAPPVANSQTRLLRLALAGFAVAVILLGVRYWMTPPDSTTPRYVLANTPIVDTIDVQDVKDAARWVRANTSFHQAPEISLGPHTKVSSVRRGDDWASFELHIGRENLRFTMARVDHFDGLPSIDLHGHTFYMTGGLGWRQNGLAYQLTGCRASDMQAYAWAAYQSIERANDGRIPGVGRRGRVLSPQCALWPSPLLFPSPERLVPTASLSFPPVARSYGNECAWNIAMSPAVREISPPTPGWV